MSRITYITKPSQCPHRIKCGITHICSKHFDEKGISTKVCENENVFPNYCKLEIKEEDMAYTHKCCGNCDYFYPRKETLGYSYTHVCTHEGDKKCPFSLYDETHCSDYKPATKRHLITTIAQLQDILCTIQAVENAPCKNFMDGHCMRNGTINNCAYQANFEQCHRFEPMDE